MVEGRLQVVALISDHPGRYEAAHDGALLLALEDFEIARDADLLLCHALQRTAKFVYVLRDIQVHYSAIACLYYTSVSQSCGGEEVRTQKEDGNRNVHLPRSLDLNLNQVYNEAQQWRGVS